MKLDSHQTLDYQTKKLSEGSIVPTQDKQILYEINTCSGQPLKMSSFVNHLDYARVY